MLLAEGSLNAVLCCGHVKITMSALKKSSRVQEVNEINTLEDMTSS
jgi:hypothetical protein